MTIGKLQKIDKVQEAIVGGARSNFHFGNLVSKCVSKILF